MAKVGVVSSPGLTWKSLSRVNQIATTSSESSSFYILCEHLFLLFFLTDPDVKSVIAINGIWGRGKKCWETNSDPSVVWLRDAFGAEKHPRLIVLEYQIMCFTLQGIYEIARRLLSSLLEIRDQAKVSLHNNATCKQLPYS